MSTTSVVPTTNTKVFQFRFPNGIRAALQLFFSDLLSSGVLLNYKLLIEVETKVNSYTQRRGDDPSAQVSNTYHLVTLTGHNPNEQDRRQQDFPNSPEFEKYIKYLVKD